MAISSSSVPTANNPPLQWKQRFLLSASLWPPLCCPTLRTNICFAKPATKNLFCCCYDQRFANSSSIPKELVFDDDNNNSNNNDDDNVVVVLPCIKTGKSSTGSRPPWSVIGGGRQTTYEVSSGKKTVDKTIYKESLKYQAMAAAVTVLGSLLMLMAYGHLPALAGGPSEPFHSLRSSSSSSSSPFCDSNEEEEEDLHRHDSDYYPSATEDQARNDISRMTCYCNRPVAIRTSWTTANPARRFRACTLFPRKSACGFFEWVDPPFSPYSLRLKHRLIQRLNKVENGTEKQHVILGLLWVIGTSLVFDRVENNYRESDVGFSKSAKGDA